MPTIKPEIEKLREVQAQEIDFLAFSGGGAKGVIYAGVVEALEHEKILHNIKAVAGSSAGAITAACVATGITSEAFTEISGTTNMKGLLGKGFLINKDGKPLYELLQRTVLRNISGFLSENNIKELCATRLEILTSESEEFYAKERVLLERQAAISSRKAEILKNQADHVMDDDKKPAAKELEELKLAEVDIAEDIEIMRGRNVEIKGWMSALQDIALNQSEGWKDLRDRCANKGKIYFRDLALMRAIDPTRFKDLVVTAVRRDNADLTIFSPHTTPDVEIALACRASASIPLVFEPVEIEVMVNGKKEKKQFIDGGYRDNIPTTHFKEITDNKEKKGRTLALAFGSNSPDDNLHTALYSSKSKITDLSKLMTFAVDVIFKFVAKIGGVYKYSESEENLMQKMRADALNVAPMDTKGVSTLAFDAAQTQADYLRIQGKLQTQRHLENMDLRQTPDNTLSEREFLLQVIENTGKDRKKSWASSAKDPMSDKAVALLSFCEESKWQGQDKLDVLEQFVALAAVNSRTGKTSSDTSTIEHLVSNLNQKTAPEAIVKQFRQLAEKTDDKPFVKGDFDKIIERNMGAFKVESKSR